MRKIYMIILLLVVGFASCKEEGFDLFTEDDGCYVSFNRNAADTINFSFYSAGTNTYNYPVELLLIGVPEPEGGKAKPLSVVIVDSLTNMDTNYVKIPKDITFQPWSLLDTIYIGLEKYAAFDQEDENGNTPVFYLCIEIQGSDDLILGDRNRRRLTFKISNDITQPSWWDATVKNNLLGVYTKKKFKLFVEVIQPDLANMSIQNLQEWTIEFKRYLERQDPPIYEEDGSLMNVVVEA